MFFRFALLISGAGLVVAQSIFNNCSTALLAVAAFSDATCLDLAPLAPLMVSNTTTSVIPTINNWLSGLCNQSPCSNATLQTVVTNIATGCSSDLASLGLPTIDPSSIVTIIQSTYSTVRQIACLKNTSANTLCATELLNDIQSTTTTLSFNNIIGLITQGASAANISFPQNITCSNCSKAAYTTVAQDLPTFLTSHLTNIQSECGSSFTNGQMPSNVKETASNSTSGTTSLSVSSLDVGVTMLIAVSFAFVITNFP